MNIIFHFSPNFSKKKRKIKDIKFVILHYTGMQSEIESINRLKNPRFKVSCHYLINRKGKIIQMVKDRNIAWHAGKSKWKNFKNLNQCSIGIELVNRGHKFGYQEYSKNQINSLLKLCKDLKKKYSIKKENFLGHSDIAPLRKIDPGEKFPWKKLSKYNFGRWYKETKQIKNSIKKKTENNFYNNLKKIGYRYFSNSKKSSKNKKIIKSFQQHYLPNNVTGKIDKKTYIISHFLSS
jgi:N-acetylmuramoyl-L-alanine amidase